MNTADLHCKTLPRVSKRTLIRAVHQCLMQLQAAGGRVEVDGRTLDNLPAITAARSVLRTAGHIGFTQ
jgi:hypothetical protein